MCSPLRLPAGLLVAAVAAVAALSLLALPTPATAAGCANADRPPGRVALDVVTRAVECEINRRRRARGLPRLDAHGRLREASEGHARDMVRHGYFSHIGLDGRSMTARLLDAGYIRAGRGWAAGEVLAWGTLGRSTARRAVSNWMNSPPHRHVLLNPRYRDVGVGVSRGTPSSGDAPGATYAAALGVLSRWSAGAAAVRGRSATCSSARCWGRLPRVPLLAGDWQISDPGVMFLPQSG